MKSYCYLAAIIVISFLLVGGGIPAQTQAESLTPIMLFVNGKQVASEVAPVIAEGRTLVPLRVIVDNLGRYVSWDEDNRRVIITKTADEMATLPSRARNSGDISIVVDGKEISSEVPPVIENGRTLVPIRVVAEGLGMKVAWDPALRQVSVDKPAADVPMVTQPPAETQPDLVNIPFQNSPITSDASILGTAQASADQLKTLLMQKNPEAPPELADLYLKIGQEYGIRGDIAFCQAAKETKWWHFGGLVQEFQNNFCGLGASGTPATGNEDLGGADRNRVSYQEGIHGAVFNTMADGVEAHIQHLYAYAVKGALPAGKSLVDPRFSRPSRGCAACWVDLAGKWAVPGYESSFACFDEAFAAGKTYGQSILNDYYAQLFSNP